MSTTVAGVEVESVEYARRSGTVRTQFDSETTSANMAVIATLAEVMDVDLDELEPLYSAVDPDALESVLRVCSRKSGDTCVTFTHEGYTVTVHSYGVVTVTPQQNHSEGSEDDF